MRLYFLGGKMKIYKPYSNKEYADLAIYCNENGCFIADQGEYLESIKRPDPTPEEVKKEEIERLKQELSETDYKIIKCSEYSLAGVELPYDIAELHAKRQALRDRINELEG